MKEKVQSIFNKFENYKVAVLGDVMLDYNISGAVNRISSEAPIPIVDVDDIQYLPGGAANVCRNIKSLGGEVYLIGVIGDDDYGRKLEHNLSQSSIDTSYLVVDSSRPTTTKMRIFTGHYQHVRADVESRDKISDGIEDAIYMKVESIVKSIDALIFQDYNKGLLTPRLIKRVISICRENNVIIAVDPKFDHFFEYHNVDIFKPNRKEIAEAFSVVCHNREEIKSLSQQLIERLSPKYVLVTLSEDGMMVMGDGVEEHIATKVSEVFDPTGAGDTVIAMLVMAYLASEDIVLSMKLANLSASIACQEVGVSLTSQKKIMQHLELLS